ncbi:MAG: alpha/beta hydrolase [Blautia sp.]|nr:esterase family protein [Blautia sp.]MDD7372143.1 alpha/beta hydrolase family protein [Bacillota bacterium]MDY3714414.1 alpha/beta hydrolase family protein [Blautia sp.]
MAYLNVEFFSDVLKMSMTMGVILPQKTDWQIGMKGCAGDGKYKTMYLLHGMSDDQSIWMRRTSIERYVSELGIAVVMPTTHLGWYTNTTYGLKYWDFISKELPAICRQFFPNMSDKKEDTLAAGLSMGGYGAWKLALGANDTFGAAASLSGAIDMATHLVEKEAEEDDTEKAFWTGVFGSPEQMKGSENDLWALAAKLKKEEKTLPRLFAWCGKQDFLYKDNVRTWEYMKKLGYPLEFHESDGDHQWCYWDEQIQNVLKWWLECV